MRLGRAERFFMGLGTLCGFLIGSLVIAWYLAFYAGAVLSMAEMGWRLGRFTW